MVVEPGLCRTWSETPKTVFLTTYMTSLLGNFGVGFDTVYMYYHQNLATSDEIIMTLSEPLHEKTCLRGFRPGPTQSGMHTHKKLLEA